MQMEYDFETVRQERLELRPKGAGGEQCTVHDEGASVILVARRPDWAELRARFLAIHALRQTDWAHSAQTPPTGSFMLAGQAVLASCRKEGEVVNLVCSGNGKDESLNKGPAVASPTPGGRGRT